MLSFTQFDLLARGGTLALLALWTWVLIRDHRNVLAARVAIALNLSIACHVIASTPDPLPGFRLLDALLDIGSSTVIGLFWLFARVWFDDVRKLDRLTVALVALPTAIVALLYAASLGGTVFARNIWFPVLRAIWFAFILGGLWITWRGRAGDLVEGRRRLRLFIMVSTGVIALMVNVVEIAVFRFGAPAEWRSMPEFFIVLATLVIMAALMAHRQADMFGPVRRAEPPGAGASAGDPLAARLLAFMEEDKPHRDEGLTIAGLAQRLGEQEYRLRRLINGTLGHRNFAQFLNGYRLAEVKSALADSSQKDVPILTIALDAGFGSLGPFNRAFREAEGMTPSEFRARAPHCPESQQKKGPGNTQASGSL